MQKVQNVCLEILNEIDRICKKHNIPYFFIGGTLLGAVRHKGFIPWDDDLDVAMAREDYERFIKICESQLNGYYLTCQENNDNHFFIFAKVCKLNTLFIEKLYLDYYKTSNWEIGIYVDVFPLDNVKKSNIFFFVRRKVVKFLSSLINIRITKRNTYESFNVLKKIVLFVFKIFNTKTLRRLRDYLCKKHNKKQTAYFCSFGSSADPQKIIYLKEKMLPLSSVEFEGKYYPAPGDPNYYLSKAYGDDYMELPPPEKRTTHNPVILSFDIEREGNHGK